MKSLSLIIAFVLCLLALGHLSAKAFSREWKRHGDRDVSAAIKQANHIFHSTGEYPAQLAVSRSEIWGVFKGPTIRFRSRNGGCAAYYYQWPLGPHKGMDCASQHWWFDE